LGCGQDGRTGCPGIYYIEPDAAEASQRPDATRLAGLFWPRLGLDFHAPRRVDYRTGATRESAAAHVPAPRAIVQPGAIAIFVRVFVGRIFPRGRISSSLKPLGSSDVEEVWGGGAMLKRFCIAFIFVAAGGVIAARAQTDSTTAAGQSQNAPRAVPCPPPDCPPQTHRSVSQDSRPQSGAGTLIRGFTLSAPPPPWHAHSM